MEASPLELFKSKRHNTKANIIIGDNYREGELFAIGEALFFNLVPPPAYLSMNESIYRQAASRVIRDATTTSYALSLYQNVAAHRGYWHALSDLLGDWLIACGTHDIANFLVSNAGGSGGVVYRYLFDHATEHYAYSFLNCTHSTELPYVFHQDLLTGAVLTPAERQLSARMIAWWTNFARTGNPNVVAAGSNGASEWPSYNGDVTKTLAHIRLDSTNLGYDPRKWKFCPRWNQFYCPNC